MTAELVKKYDAQIAKLWHGNKEWVESTAREVDVTSVEDMRLARELSDLMDFYLKYSEVEDKEAEWAGVSSNNILWNGSEVPIAVVKVPDNAEYVTMLNPRALKFAGSQLLIGEGCGALDDSKYIVPRAEFATFLFYDLDGKRRTRTFGVDKTHNPVPFTKILTQAESGYAQHEVDHLSGIVLPDRTLIKTPPLDLDFEEDRQVLDSLLQHTQEHIGDRVVEGIDHGLPNGYKIDMNELQATAFIPEWIREYHRDDPLVQLALAHQAEALHFLS